MAFRARLVQASELGEELRLLLRRETRPIILYPKSDAHLSKRR